MRSCAAEAAAVAWDAAAMVDAATWRLRRRLPTRRRRGGRCGFAPRRRWHRVPAAGVRRCCAWRGGQRPLLDLRSRGLRGARLARGARARCRRHASRCGRAARRRHWARAWRGAARKRPRRLRSPPPPAPFRAPGAAAAGWSPGAVVPARLMPGGSTSVTKLRDRRCWQPAVTVTVTTGSSIAVVVVTRTSRSPGFGAGSTEMRTAAGATRKSPESTSAVTHSRARLSSLSRRTVAAKLSGWPRCEALTDAPARPKPSACASPEADSRPTREEHGQRAIPDALSSCVLCSKTFLLDG